MGDRSCAYQVDFRDANRHLGLLTYTGAVVWEPLPKSPIFGSGDDVPPFGRMSA